MEDDGCGVFVDKFAALGNGGHVGWASGGSSIVRAAKGAFHAHPLADDDLFGVDPFKIVKIVFVKQGF